MTATYVLGIDLGTTNSVVAYAPLDAKSPEVELLELPQLVAANTIESRNSLPSFLYVAPEHEAASGALDLPWQSGQPFAVGEFARRQGAEMPERTVVAAKSWLAHSRVDRREPIFPQLVTLADLHHRLARDLALASIKPLGFAKIFQRRFNKLNLLVRACR